jgi:hypothetical protein
MAYTYDWETCLLLGDEWARMIERRNEKGWRMVSASVVAVKEQVIAYVFWESEL